MTKRRLISIILTLLIIFMLSMLAMAQDSAIDYNRKGSISITLRDSAGEHEVVRGITLRLYRVADISRSGFNISYEATDDFADSGISFDDLNAEGLAEHLAAYAQDRGAVYTSKHGDTLVFDELALGLYLIVQEGSASGYYPIAPFLISVPMTNMSGTGWNYDVDASPKAQAIPSVVDPILTRVSVKKVWKDTGENRPACIEVALMRDGEVYDTVILDQYNEWIHTWDKLDARFRWSIAEIEVPNGYEVSYSSAGSTFTITNTETTTPPPDDTTTVPDDTTTVPDDSTTVPDDTTTTPEDSTTVPDDTTTTPEDSTTVPDDTTTTPDDSTTVPDDTTTTPDDSTTVPDETTGTPDDSTSVPDVEIPAEPDEPGEPMLPQTGQLNWPIPVLAGAGVVLFMIGWAVMFVGKKNDHAE